MNKKSGTTPGPAPGGKNKRRGKEPRTRPDGTRDWSKLEAAAQKHAGRLGLYLLFSGSGTRRKWTVAGPDGSAVLYYFPQDLTWERNSGEVRRGKAGNCHEMLEMIDRERTAGG
ncbi:MAG: hypothetical protein ACRC7O_06315 [Fimbriiglobus sp.]